MTSLRSLMAGTAAALLCSLALAAGPGPDLPAVQKWAQSAKVAGYTFAGAEESDPGVYMAVWQNSQGQMIALHVSPSSHFKGFNQVVNKKKPQAFTYRSQPALYSDALGSTATLAVHFEKAGKVLSLTHMNQPRALSQDELLRLLDGLEPSRLLP